MVKRNLYHNTKKAPNISREVLGIVRRNRWSIKWVLTLKNVIKSEENKRTT